MALPDLRNHLNLSQPQRVELRAQLLAELGVVQAEMQGEPTDRDLLEEAADLMAQIRLLTRWPAGITTQPTKH